MILYHPQTKVCYKRHIESDAILPSKRQVKFTTVAVRLNKSAMAANCDFITSTTSTMGVQIYAEGGGHLKSIAIVADQGRFYFARS